MDNHTRSNDFHSSPSQRHSRQESRVWGDYALWVGNLPQQTTVMALRDYFSEPCPRDLLSISYNPDAKYAFVNFGTESARNAAIQQAASQTLDGKRLDCRIRQDSISRSTKVNYGLNQKGRRRPSWGDRSNELLCKVEEFSHFPESHQLQWGKEKYFIIKSFSIEALYQSLESNQWYVPKRHIDRLNLAFQTASKVYLFFSVNGSGQFFGCAVMTSEIRSVEEASVRPSNDIHMTDSVSDNDVFEATENERDMTSPSRSSSRSRTHSARSSISSSGSIYYEPERRRIIWEASSLQATRRESLSSDDDLQTPSRPPQRTASPSAQQQSHPNAQPGPRVHLPWSAALESPSPFQVLAAKLERFSSPCQIKWLSTQSIPFNEVRGLRNAWNSNKEVHVARNVTVVEPSAGAGLLRYWKDKAEIRRMEHTRDAIAMAWPAPF